MQIAIATNTLAGSGKAVKLAAAIQEILQKKQIISQIFTEKEWDKSIYDFDQIWITGGDGTLNYFINQFHDIKKPLCIFKGGTGNDFHALLYGKTETHSQIEHILHSVPKPIDAGLCNERYFLNGVGIGFEGAVARSLQGVNKWGGKTSFMLSILKHILFYKEQEYIVASAEKTVEGKMLMISIANGTRYGGGFYVAPLAKPDDGLFDANLVKPLTPLKRLRYLPVIEKGKHLGLSIVDYYNTTAITVKSKQLIQSHLDGEYLESNELKITMLPGHFNFIF
ncbi:MAG: YegS/Rv2252/BmrU family lipid kinase [Chitinophagaceae bacterium]|nr:YegS/Rv2252/BmrU family lipid kinase [Chitinophagaceae bacterium]